MSPVSVRDLRITALNDKLETEDIELREENARLKLENQLLRNEIAGAGEPAAPATVSAFGHGVNGWQRFNKRCHLPSWSAGQE